MFLSVHEKTLAAGADEGGAETAVVSAPGEYEDERLHGSILGNLQPSGQ
ncbi:hypothetical protein [Luteococcus sediminum]